MTVFEFESRCLYDQKTLIEDEMYVYSKVYAVSYLYPGAISRTTGRCRLTCVYRADSLAIQLSGGTIEKWSDKGWINIEEIFDAHISFDTIEEVFEHLHSMYKSFVLGVPTGTNNNRTPEPQPKPPGPDKKPTLRVLSFKNKPDTKEDVITSGSSDQKNPQPTGKDNKDDNDFDWI